MPVVEEADYLKLLVYAPPGHGKTTLLGTGIGDPRLSPILLLDFEGGTASIKSKCRTISIDDLLIKDEKGKLSVNEKWVPKGDKIDVIKIHDWDDFNAVYEFLDNSEVYKTIAVDSLSEVNYLLMADVLDRAVKQDSKHDPDIPEQRDYLRSAQMMRKLIRYFRDLEMNLILTCSAMSGEDQMTRRSQAQPNLTGKLAGEVPGLVSIVSYLAISEDTEGNPIRVLVSEPSDRFMAKARVENADGVGQIENPTLPLLLDKLGVSTNGSK